MVGAILAIGVCLYRFSELGRSCSGPFQEGGREMLQGVEAAFVRNIGTPFHGGG